MQVKSIEECSKGSILQYYRPSLSYNLSLKYFLSGSLRQVILYLFSSALGHRSPCRRNMAKGGQKCGEHATPG